MGMGGAGWRQPWDSLGGTDLIGVPAGVIQSQQQRHETLQHQLPQGAAESRSPPQPRRTSVPRSPTAEARTESRACIAGRGQGGASRERVSGGLPSGGVISGPGAGPGWGTLGEPGEGVVTAGGAGPEGRAHVFHKRWEERSQLRAQEPHRRPRPHQDPPQRPQCGAHEPRATLAQGAQERGQQRAHVTHLQGRGLVGDPSQTPPRPRPVLPLTFLRFSARWPRPSRPSQCTVGSGSPCQAQSRSRMTSSRRSRVVGRLCNSWAGGHRVSTLAFPCRPGRLGAKSMVTPHHPSWKRAHSAEEGHSREALCVFRAAQLGQQVREQASQVVVGVRHHGTVMRRK